MKISRAEFLRKVGGTLAGAALGGGLLQATGWAEEEIRRAKPLGDSMDPVDAASAATTWANSGPGFGHRIAVTFDDGPHPTLTPKVLGYLRERDVRATFFVIGENAARHPEILQQVVAEGHEVANHSYTHPKLSSMSDSAVERELHKTQEAIAAAIGHPAQWFRPPYGAFRHNQEHLAAAEGLGVMLWSVDPRDWSRPGVQAIVSRILGATRPGSVVLMHDIHAQTVEALPYVLDGLVKDRYEFTNISGFLGQPYPAV